MPYYCAENVICVNDTHISLYKHEVSRLMLLFLNVLFFIFTNNTTEHL